MNNVTYFKNCVTFILIKILNLVIYKLIHINMKEKDNYKNLSDRWTARDETNNIWGLLLYSAGEDFYNIYQEDKDIEPKKIAEIDIN